MDSHPLGSSLSMGFSGQEYWSGLPCPSPGDLPNTGTKLRSPTLQVDSCLCEPPGKMRVFMCLWPCHWEETEKHQPLRKDGVVGRPWSWMWPHRQPQGQGRGWHAVCCAALGAGVTPQGTGQQRPSAHTSPACRAGSQVPGVQPWVPLPFRWVGPGPGLSHVTEEGRPPCRRQRVLWEGWRPWLYYRVDRSHQQGGPGERRGIWCQQGQMSAVLSSRYFMITVCGECLS